jgi:alkylresorcinol/alkylpyrone synthase
MTLIAGAASAFPTHYYDQETLIAYLRNYWQAGGRLNLQRLESIQRNTSIKGRYLALPIDSYDQLSGFSESNQAWQESALQLGKEVLCSLFDSTRIDPSGISMLTFTTVTGLSVPSLDARLMNVLPFRQDMKRMPIFGLGCLAGAAGVARVGDYLDGHPGEAAVLLSVELCSLTIQKDDLSIENIVASGLFGDGAAAVLLVGDKHPLADDKMPRIVESRSVFFPNSEHIMGWEFRNTGMKVLLSADVSIVAENEVPPVMKAFLAEHDLEIGDITHWIAHPGGPKVIEALERGLALEPDALDISRTSLAEVGNISSTSVLLILEETLRLHRPPRGTYGMMMAMGPAFSAELVLLQW